MLAHAGNPDGVRIGHVGQLLDDPLRGEAAVGRFVPCNRIILDPLVDDVPPVAGVGLAVHGLLSLDLRDEVLEHSGHIADDRHVRLTVLADFRRIDVDMDHTRTRRERVELASDAVVETCADRDQQVAALHGAGRRDRAMHAEHAEHLRIGIRHDAARRKGGDDRSAGHIGQLLDQLARVGTHRAAADVQHRTVRLLEQLRRVGQHATVRLGGRVVARQNHALRPGIIHLAGLRGLGDVHHHRSRTAGACDVVRLGQHARNVLRAGDEVRMLDHRIGGADDIGFLESVRADGVHADLAGDDDHRNGIHVRVGDRGDHVRRARTGSDDAHAHLSGGQRVAFCRMSGGLLVTHQHEAELRIVLDGIVDGQNRTARNAEDVLDAQILQRTNQRFGAGHLFAVDNGLLFSGSGCLWHAAECLQRRR